MPEPLTKELGDRLRSVVGDAWVIADPDRLLAYESDGLTAYRKTPRAVVLPRDTNEISCVLGILSQEGVPVVPRGAGTGLSGGALADSDAVVVGTARMTDMLELDPDNRLARVQPGMINANLTAAAEPFGLYYAPDPSSQSACTLGGNIAENSGGRRPGRRRRQRRCRHHHLQLRRHQQAFHRHRGRRLHRLQRGPRRPGQGRRRRHDRGGQRHHQGRGGGRARRHQVRPEGNRWRRRPFPATPGQGWRQTEAPAEKNAQDKAQDTERRLVSWIRHMAPIRRLSEFTRPDAWGAVMREHHKRRATPPVSSESRPSGRVSRFLGGRGGAPRIWNRGDTPRWPPGASGALADGLASPARAFLPRKRETRSYGYHMSDPGH